MLWTAVALMLRQDALNEWRVTVHHFTNDVRFDLWIE